MRVLKVPCCEKPELAEMEWEDIRNYLFGMVECVTIGDGACLLCFEEAKIYKMRPNRRFRNDIICTDFLIVGQGTEDFTDLSDELIRKYSEIFAEPEFMFKFPPKENDNEKKYVKYELWQCDTTNHIGVQILFSSHDFTASIMEANHISSLRPYYKKVYTGMEYKRDSVYATLESVFCDHNGHIKDRRGHSMSVSDIVVLYLDGDKTEAYYTDSIGFQKIDF